MFLWGKKKEAAPQVRIVTLEEPLLVVGLETDTDMKSVFTDVPRLGKEYGALKERTGIPNLREPWAFVAVSRDTVPEMGTWTYLIGDVVTAFEGAPAEAACFRIPAGTYAVFTVVPKNRLDWGFAISRMKQYIYGTWLPDSDWQAAGEVDDFEWHDERSKRSKGAEIDLYVSVRPKGAAV